MKGQEGPGDPEGREAKSGQASSRGGLDTSCEKGFFADVSDKFSVRSGRIHGVAPRPSHHDRVSGEEHISRSIGHSDTRKVMFSDCPAHVPPTIADTGYTEPSVGEDSPTYALRNSRRMAGF